jgi:hypothetical protein
MCAHSPVIKANAIMSVPFHQDGVQKMGHCLWVVFASAGKSIFAQSNKPFESAGTKAADLMPVDWL